MFTTLIELSTPLLELFTAFISNVRSDTDVV